MSEDEYTVPTGPFKGKRIEIASTVGIEMFKEIAAGFMFKVFGFEAGDYLITDESSLHDFTGVDDMELADIHEKILHVYALDVSDLKSAYLLEIFVRIHEQQADTE